MPVDSDSFGQRVIELRRRRGFSQEQLGNRLGISGQAVSKWEQRSALPDAALLPTLAAVLESSIDHLLGVDDQSGLEELARGLRRRLQALAPGPRRKAIATAFRLAFMGIEDAGGDPVAQIAWTSAPNDSVAELTAAGDSGWALLLAGERVRHHPDLGETSALEVLAVLSDPEIWDLLRQQLDGEEVRAETRRASRTDDNLRRRLDRLVDAGLVTLERGGFIVAPAGLLWLAVLAIAPSRLGALHSVGGRP